MKLNCMTIRNFKSIRQLSIDEIEEALIVVGKNSTGKTVILSALLAVVGKYEITRADFLDLERNIEIGVTLELTEADLRFMNQRGIVSKFKRYDLWRKDFCAKLPSYRFSEETGLGLLTFSLIVGRDGIARYADGFRKDNEYIPYVLPKVHYIDTSRQLTEIQNDIFLAQGQEALTGLREATCMFDAAKACTGCYQCIGAIAKKEPEALTVHETAKLLEYKLYHLNLDSFVERLNGYFHKNNSPMVDVKYAFRFDVDALFSIETYVEHHARNDIGAMQTMSTGTRSIYILSLLEAYVAEEGSIPCMILIEDPEIYLHPQLQKVAGEILYRLSKKNQVVFSTHSPNMLFNFTSRQIRQVVLDQDSFTTVNEDADIDEILDDLGYTANDLMNVSFVFIVEGKQDSSRLPLLLEKYYSEIYNEDGMLQRIAIITTNSCTNIRTYANLKYINKLYLKDQFLMIRDGDGKDKDKLVNQLCGFYHDRQKQDGGNLPRVLPRNVLVLNYYSFENYFLDPVVMTKIGVVKSEEAFYSILYKNYRKYLYKLSSVRKMLQEYPELKIRSAEDIRANMELFRIHVRGHNLYDMFYGRYKGEEETRILTRYIDEAPRWVFQDILDAIDSFVYFESRRK